MALVGCSGDFRIQLDPAAHYRSRMTQVKQFPAKRTEAPRLSIEQLEAGLRIMAADGFSSHDFWDEHVASFRQTVLFAIHETSDALLSPTIPLRTMTG